MTDTTHEQKKQRLTKRLALVGLLAILLLVAWLSVRIVTLAPSTFSSLASITNSLYGSTPFSREYDITTTTVDDIIQSGESTTLTWNDAPRTGTFVFSYECIDGVSIDITTDNDGQRPVVCGTAYDIGTITTLEVAASSEKNRFTDVPVTIAFVSDDGESRTDTTDILTVVNASIAPVAINDSTDTDTPATEDTTNDTSSDATDTPSTETVPGTEPTTPPPPRVTEVTYVYDTPVSDPLGYTDLAIRYRGVGYIEDGQFVNTGTIAANKLGAIQFEVENTGTKTSNVWSFTTTLPNGTTYQSDTQTGLGPKERAILSIGFPSPDAGSTATFSFVAQTGGDIDVSNNDFSWSAEVRD